jgi:hypothetical protein
MQQIRHGDRLYRNSEYIPEKLTSIEELVRSYTLLECYQYLHMWINPHLLDDFSRSQVIIHLYAKYMDDLGVDSVVYSPELTRTLFNRLIVTWFMYIQVKRGLLRPTGPEQIYSDNITNFVLTESGVAYELFRTNSGLRLPAVTDIFYSLPNE